MQCSQHATPVSNTRGIIVYISNSFNSKEVLFNSNFQEQLFVRIELLNHCYLLVGAMYRSPSADPPSLFKEVALLLKTLLMQTFNSHTLLLSDFEKLATIKVNIKVHRALYYGTAKMQRHTILQVSIC